MEMERALEAFVALSGLVIGLSHLLRPNDSRGEGGRLFRFPRQGVEVDGLRSELAAGVVAAGGAMLAVSAWACYCFGVRCT